MKLKFFSGALFFSFLLIVSACSSDDGDSTSPNKNASLTLKAASSLLKSPDNLVFTEAIIHVEEVEFEALEVGDDDLK